jgi:arylsulfatase A-like enzyme
MKGHQFTVVMLLAAVLWSCQPPAFEPPNILFILADDFSYNAVHVLGNDEVRTPAIDALAKRGTIFTNTYNMGGWNGAVCIASRTMLNTGRFLWNANKLDRHLDSVAHRDMLWSRELAKLGYETYFTGKWHVGIDPGSIFDHVGTVRPGMPADTPEGYNRPLGESDRVWTPWDTAFGGYWEGGTHWSEVVANETISFLQESSGSEKPFFMYVAFNAPHDPRQSPKDMVEDYPLDNISLPESYQPLYPYREEIGCGPGLRDEALAPFPRTPYAVRVHRQEYYAIITHLDAQIKRIMDQLEETGQSDHTIVVFTADQGLAVGCHGLMGKQNMYEHSIRPPMIIAGPGIPAGEMRDAAIYLQDIMPTAIEYAGGEVPGYVEYHSMKPFLDGNRRESYYPQMYGAYMDLQRMIRKDHYKLIYYPVARITRLFNLADDRQELNDLATDPFYSVRVQEMYSELEQLMGAMGDTLHLPALN